MEFVIPLRYIDLEESADDESHLAVVNVTSPDDLVEAFDGNSIDCFILFI